MTIGHRDALGIGHTKTKRLVDEDADRLRVGETRGASHQQEERTDTEPRPFRARQAEESPTQHLPHIQGSQAVLIAQCPPTPRAGLGLLRRPRGHAALGVEARQGDGPDGRLSGRNTRIIRRAICEGRNEYVSLYAPQRSAKLQAHETLTDLAGLSAAELERLERYPEEAGVALGGDLEPPSLLGGERAEGPRGD